MSSVNKKSLIQMIPNFITLFRILAAPFFAYFIAKNKFANFVPSVIFVSIYTLTAFTDKFDGTIARKYNINSNLGKCIDPIADKIFVSTILLALVYVQKAWLVTVALIMTREFVIAGLREFAALSKGLTVEVTGMAKLKTGLQMTAIGTLIFFNKGSTMLMLANVLLAVATFVSLLTMVQYIAFAHKKHIFNTKNK